MHTLISFLGKANKKPGESGTSGYRSANYQFDGELITEKYFGLALIRQIKPERIVVVGTAGSMWDVFFEDQHDSDDEGLLQVMEAMDAGQLTEGELQRFEQRMSQRLELSVEFMLIPVAKTAEDQVQILTSLSKRIAAGEKVTLDVTHGFRHLPMLALVAAQFLSKVKGVEIKAIYYAALDMTSEDKTPVLDLAFMLRMLDWVGAFTSFDKDGDYSVFAELLVHEGLDNNAALQLKQAAFHERTNNSSQASQKLSSAAASLQALSTPIYDLFKLQLEQRLSWFKKSSRGLKEQTLAKAYLKRSDYLRTSLFAFEGLISEHVRRSAGDINHFDERHKAVEELKENASFKTLNNLRNAMAHGVKPFKNSEAAIKALENEQIMQQSLKDRLEHLFK